MHTTHWKAHKWTHAKNERQADWQPQMSKQTYREKTKINTHTQMSTKTDKDTHIHTQYMHKIHVHTHKCKRACIYLCTHLCRCAHGWAGLNGYKHTHMNISSSFTVIKRKYLWTIVYHWKILVRFKQSNNFSLFWKKCIIQSWKFMQPNNFCLNWYHTLIRQFLSIRAWSHESFSCRWKMPLFFFFFFCWTVNSKVFSKTTPFH